MQMNTSESPHPAEKPPLLSVITPSYNSADYIAETLDSVAALPFGHEHIVVDGGSTDATAEILAGRDDPRLTWISEPDRGQTHAVNKGFARARGKYLAWLNADDAYVPAAVAKSIDALEADPAIAATFGFTDIVTADGELSRQYRCGPFSWFRFLYAGDFIPTPTIIFRRSVYEQVGPLDERWHDAADYDFYLRIFRGREVRRIERSVVRFRIHDASKTGSNLRLQLDEALKIRLAYASTPLQRALMRAISGSKAARDRIRPFWRETAG